MLPPYFIGVAILIRLISGGRYAWGVLRGRARPNPVTWFFWGVTAMVAFVAQVHENAGVQALVTFVLGLSPLIIFCVALTKDKLAPHLTPFTNACAAMTVLGIVLWQATDNANLAIIFSIFADIAASMPTLLKSYHDPDSEYSFPYFLSVVSMAVTLLTIDDWDFSTYGFPLYMLLINVALWALARFTWRPDGKVRPVA